MTPQNYFPVFARMRIQAPHVFAEKLIPQEIFPACIGFVPGGNLPRGPKDWKFSRFLSGIEIFKREWNLQSRMKSSIEPHSKGSNCGEFSRSRLKCSSENAVFKREWNFHAKSLKISSVHQISFEPGFGAYQGLAQKIKVPFSRIFSVFLQFCGFEGDFRTRAKPRYAPNSGWNAFRVQARMKIFKI